jgi:hypothetical protein
MDTQTQDQEVQPTKLNIQRTTQGEYCVRYAEQALATWGSISRASQQVDLLTRHPEWILGWLTRGQGAV